MPLECPAFSAGRMIKLFSGIISVALVTLLLLAGAGRAQEMQAVSSTAKAVDESKSRLVMLEIEHWKTAFFGLPKEVPLLVKPGEPLNAHLRNYDFNQGMQAMVIFLTLRPKDPQAGAYRRFLKKWPAYQSFFKSVDAHDFTAAARSLAEVQALDPAEPAVWFYQGSLSTQTGDYAEAEKDYRACLKIFPDYGPAYINLARLAKRRGAANEAKTVLQEALQHVTPDEQKSSRLTVQAMLADLEKP